MKDIVLLDTRFSWYSKKKERFIFDSWHFYARLQLSKPFMVKKWCFVKRINGFNIHLFPLHIHITY